MKPAGDTRFGAACTRMEHAMAQSAPEYGFGSGGLWRWGYATLIGRRHQQQTGGVCEDAVCVRLLDEPSDAGSTQRGPDRAIHIALADGVSGGACGRVAAQAYVHHCVNWNPLGAHDLRDWLAVQADRQVRAALRLHTREPGASTGAAAWIDAQGGARIHRIGDCRAYLWCAAQDRPVVLKQIMADQTMAYMGYVDADSPRAAQPSHMVGNGNAGDPEFVTLHMPHSGGLLLCSDGFHEVIRQAALAAYLTTLSGLFEKHGAAYLGHWCECLVRQAKELGTNDDVSVLVLGKSAGRMA